MRSHTIADLQSILDDEMAWRRREISSLVTLMKASAPTTQNILIRAAIPLLYAHWEGFGRACLSRYLEFVSYRSKRFKELKPSFLYLAMAPSLKEASKGNISAGINIFHEANRILEEKNKDPFRKRINTRSNLRHDVLLELLVLCGLAAEEFESYSSFINQEICDPRNEIAHGSGGAPQLDTFLRRRDEAFGIMTQLQTAVTNAAIGESYLIATGAAA
jgi:hypothetical protein